ncbi:MAG: YedE family putative selenium transporter [Miniphocaeibacter sp.]|uniref:YedE family putative selenium transporter n=1 Tax=Miniphocaeibacter sp. TaxID=3100973 RepID=UPI0017AE816E|nr:YedE-related selenium metabolism membrane protein [Gallicola sp.]
MRKENIKIFIGGFIIGIIGILLMYLGNPDNMGICIACFWRDIAGALGLHRAEVVQYIRPEIIGIIGGAFISSIISKDFKGRGGSNPAIRFVLGVFMSIGALVFLGCPLRMIFRIAAGDLNAVIGLLGFIFGVLIGIFFLKRGYSLGKSVKESKLVGMIIPALGVILLIFLLIKPAFIFFSKEGPGSMHAKIIYSLIGGLIVGVILQRTRICTGGAFRDVFLIKDMHFLWGIIGIFVAALLGSLILTKGHLNIGFENQPVAHNNTLWNFLGMTLVGLIAVLLGGCPIRQTVLSSEGDGDATVTIFGIILGSAIAHNFGLASSAEGATANGKIAVLICLVLTIIIAYTMTNFSNKEG